MNLTEFMAIFKAITTNPFAVVIFMAVVLKMMLSALDRKITDIHNQILDIKAAILKINDMLISHAERISRLEGRLHNTNIPKGGSHA